MYDWVKIEDIGTGDRVLCMVDDYLPCMSKGNYYEVEGGFKPEFLVCKQGSHFLRDIIENGRLLGFIKAEFTPFERSLHDYINQELVK